MNITVICTGKIRERFFTDAITEYSKRLSRYCRLQILETADEPAPENAGKKREEAIKQIEGERILRLIPPRSYVVALAIDGKRFSSEGFAGKIEELGTGGCSQIVFLIGGSLGLSRECLDRADLAMSFSDMTFPHQLMRVILLEQVYRAFRIIHGEPYHK